MAFYTLCLFVYCVIHLNILRFSKSVLPDLWSLFSHFENHVNFQSSFVHKYVFIWKLVFTTVYCINSIMNTFIHTDSVIHTLYGQIYEDTSTDPYVQRQKP